MRSITDAQRQTEKLDRELFAQFKANIFCLKDLSHVEQMGLFIVLVLLHQSDQKTFERIKTACSQEDIGLIDQLLSNAYHTYDLLLPNQGKSISEALRFNVKKNTLSPHINRKILQNLLNLMTQASALSKNKNRLSRYLKQIIRQQSAAFQHSSLDVNAIILIKNVLDTYGLNEQSVLCDGSAGIEMLARELIDESNATAILEYQSSSLKQLADQLLTLEGIEQNKIKLTLTNPLSNWVDANRPKADFYVSFPNQHPLNFQERNALHSFSLISNKGELSRNASDALWIQYALSSLKANGMAIIAVQDGFLRRPGYDFNLRKYLIDNHLVEMIIALDESNAKQTQYNSISLIVINIEPKVASDTVKFIDLRSNNISLESYPEIMDSLLSETDDYDSMSEHMELPRLRYDVSYQTLKEHNYNLHLTNYWPTIDAALPPSLTNAKKHYVQAKEKLSLTMLVFEESLGSREQRNYLDKHTTQLG